MSTNKKFRIQNGADIHGGGLSIDDVIVIGADGKVVAGAIQEAVAELTAADIADLQSQVTAILGTSPETLDTLQEIVTAFQDADTNLVASVASNASDIATINATLTSGVATPADVATLEETIGDTTLLPPAPPTFDGRLVVQSKSGPSDYPEAIHIYDPENPTTPISIVNPAVDGEHAWDRFGESVAQSGSVLAVASPAEESDSGNSNLGVVWIYDTNDLSAAPTAVTPLKPNTGFGATGSIALSSTHLFVGAPWWYTPSTRQEFLDLGDWSARYLEAPGAVLIYSLADLSADPVILHSDSPSSSGSSTGFGYSVNVSNNKLIVGSINDLVANGGSSTDDENTAPHGGGSATIFDISGGVSSLTSSSYSHKLTAQSSVPGWKNFGRFSFVDGDDLWLSTGSPSYGSAGTTYNLPVGNVGGSIHKFSLSNPTSTPIVSFTSSDFSNGGSASDYFGENIAFTDTHVVISAHGQDNSGGSMSGFVYLYDKSSGNKSSLNFPPSHVTQSAEFGRSIAVVDDELYVTRYVTYGQDTNTSNATPNGNGEVWVYNANNLSSTPTALYEANVNSNEEFGLSLHTIGIPVASVGQLTVAQSINELQSEIESLSSLQSGDTSSLTSAIATAKSEAISTAAADATTKADQAEADAKAYADQAEADAKAYADQVVAATVDAAPAALDTLNELAAALGDDANFASTVTASIATKADDAATTAALATKADQTSLDTLDAFVGDGRTGPPNAITSIAASNWTALKSGITITDNPDGSVTFTTDGSNAGEMAEILVDVDNIPYEFEASVSGYHATSHELLIKRASDNASMTGFAFNTGGSVGGNNSGWSNTGGYADQVKVIIKFGSVPGGTSWTFNSISLYDPNAADAPALETTAQTVADAVNELHTELNALSSTQSGDTSSLTSAIATAKSEAISTASADATAKADSAEADAKAYADQVVAATVDAAPAALDTLNELAAALGDDANFASTVTASIATKASQVDHDAEVARATAAEQANAAAIAAANARTSGLSTSSGSTDIEMTANVTLGDNNITDVNDIYAARGFIDTVESNDLKVQTGTADFEGSIVNFGSATITGSGFSTASNNAVDNHINVSTANAGEFVKWTGTDYEWTDLVSGRLATDQLQVDTGGSIAFMGPGGTLDVQDAIVVFSGSDVRMPTPTNAGQGANKGYVDAETTLVAGDGISVDNLTHTVALDGSAISQNLVPSDDNMYTLGSPDKVWKDVYIGPGSLYIGGQKVIEDNAGTITVNADPNQNLTVQTTGTGGLNVQSTGSGGVSIDAASEAVQVKSDMVVSVGKTISTVGGAATKFGGDIDMQTNTVSGLGAPSMDADAATKLYVDDRIAESTISGGKTFADDVVISGNLTVSGTTTTVNSETISLADNIIDLNSNLTSGAPSEDAGIRIMRGDASAVQLRWNETSDQWETYNGSDWTKIALDTDDLAEGSTNKYFTDARAKACLTGGLCITYNSTTGEIKIDETETESSLRVAESVASDDAAKLDGQEGTYYRINVYNVAGTLVN